MLKDLKQSLMKELSDTDFSQVYEDLDILTCISLYNDYQANIDNPNTPKLDKILLQKEFSKIEKECLTKNKLIKLIGEDKSYYCYKNEIYDNNGNIVESDFDTILDEDDLFCEYHGDNIYELMKKLATKKVKKYNLDDEY